MSLDLGTLNFSNELAFHYKNGFNGTATINYCIAKALGPELYQKFCAIMDDDSKYNAIGNRSRKFKVEFLDNPLDDTDILKDHEIAENFAFHVLHDAVTRTVTLYQTI